MAPDYNTLPIRGHIVAELPKKIPQCGGLSRKLSLLSSKKEIRKIGTFDGLPQLCARLRKLNGE
jgi:hypothetical protein